MSNFEERLNHLQARLENILKYQEYFQREITQIRYEINVLRSNYQKQSVPPQQNVYEKPPIRENVPPTVTPKPNSEYKEQAPPNFEQNYSTPYYAEVTQKEKNNLEKFIGENLISKIGIVILIIGVAIGAKYAIDNNLISPMTRIIFGYLVGLGLIGFAVKLKAKYLNFSSVLLSGGMATMYFITYFAYSYYQLISQISAFSVMLIFTLFTVISAIIYNRQVIAQIGLVGAYAVPFLLSENSGRVDILFSYIAIINIGILAVSTYKYWKSLLYSSFIFTWVIYAGWFAAKYLPSQNFSLAFTFLSIFFGIFYLTFLSYKLLKHKPLGIENVFLILSNSFIFYGFGYSILDESQNWNNYLGFFTIFNAFVHFVVSFIIKKLELGDKTTFYLTIILVLTFTSIAFPIQSHGNWITLFWTAEAAILFWIGRTKNIALFENYSYPLMFLASIALLRDWGNLYGDYSYQAAVFPFLNKYFVSGIFFVVMFGLINVINLNKNYQKNEQSEINMLIKYIIAGVFIFVLYNIFRIEIGNYFHWKEVVTSVRLLSEINNIPDSFQYDATITPMNIIWQFNYTLFFLTVLSWLNIKKFKDTFIGFANLSLNAIVTAFYLLVGLYLLSDLRDYYFHPINPDYFPPTTFLLIFRYFSIPFVLLLFWASYAYIKEEFINSYIPFKLLLTLFDLGFYFSIWVIISSELLHWMDIFGVQDSYKLGLSILWGVYALLMIILGIYLRRTHLRISAIVLFSITLIKLFLYDLSDLGTISKTVVFVSLGILLLIVSFLYNKYRHLIFDEGLDEGKLNENLNS